MAASTPENPNGGAKSLFGRLLTLLGDDLGHRHLFAGGQNGKVIASTRLGMFTVFAGLNGAGGATISNVNTGDTPQVGDFVVAVLQLNGTPSDASASFEKVISVVGQIQQTSTSNLSANTYQVLTRPQS